MPDSPAHDADHPAPKEAALTEEAAVVRYCPVCRQDLTGDLSGTCPNCKRPFDPEDLSTTSPYPVALCTKCGYDMVGLDACGCPECGTPYDPLDRETFRVPGERRHSGVRTWRVLVAVALVLFGLVAVRESWIPRPALGPGGDIRWTVWLWMGDAYGTEYVRPSPNTIRVRFWDGVARSASGYVPDPSSLSGGSIGWRIERVSDDEWSLEILRPGAPWQDMLLGFNSMRTPEEVLGVRIRELDRSRSTQRPGELSPESQALLDEIRGFESVPPPQQQAPPRPLGPLPVRARGDDIAVLQAFIDHFGLVFTPGITWAGDEEVWLTDEDGQLVSMSAGEAEARGHVLSVVSGHSVSRVRARYR